MKDSTPSVEDLQQEIRSLRQQLSQSQALATIGELTSTTTHEFNNVLMTILNYARLGLRHQDVPSRDKALRKILDAAERAAKVTRVILGAARNRRGEFAPTDLESLIRDSLVLLERELNKYRVLVELKIDKVPLARADGNQIQRVLLNLLINARQAMPQGGSVTISLTHDVDAQQVNMTIRDTGCGIAPEALPKIFEPFFSTKQGPDESGKGGTGLGLSSCREIIAAHGGKIRVESTVGKGTAFSIRLPVAQDNIAAA